MKRGVGGDHLNTSITELVNRLFSIYGNSSDTMSWVLTNESFTNKSNEVNRPKWTVFNLIISKNHSNNRLNSLNLLKTEIDEFH